MPVFLQGITSNWIKCAFYKDSLQVSHNEVLSFLFKNIILLPFRTIFYRVYDQWLRYIGAALVLAVFKSEGDDAMSNTAPSLEEELAVLEHTRAELTVLLELALSISWPEIANTLNIAIAQADMQVMQVKRKPN